MSETLTLLFRHDIEANAVHVLGGTRGLPTVPSRGQAAAHADMKTATFTAKSVDGRFDEAFGAGLARVFGLSAAPGGTAGAMHPL